MPEPRNDRAGQAQMARRHREGRHTKPREGCPLCIAEGEPASTRLAGWAANTVDQVVRVAKRARSRGSS